MTPQVAPVYWLFTRARTEHIALHQDDCVTRRGLHAKQAKRWTGPLTCEQVAILPLGSYFLCACVANGNPKVLTRKYGPRRVRSRHNRMSIG